MALTPSFTVSQLAGDKSVITVTDASTGSDGSLTSRRVYLKKHDGSYLVKSGTTTTYEAWAIGSPSIDLDLMDKDYSLDITINWLFGNTIVYTATTLYNFDAYAQEFSYSLTQYQSGAPKLLSNPNFYSNKMKLRVFIDDAKQAVERFNDQVAAQFSLNSAKELIDNPIYFY